MGDTSFSSSAPNPLPAGDDLTSSLHMLYQRNSWSQVGLSEQSMRIFDDDAFYPDLFVQSSGMVTLGSPQIGAIAFNVIIPVDTPFLLSFTFDGTNHTLRAENLADVFSNVSSTFLHLLGP